MSNRTGEGNGNPLQCSLLENPRDGGAWWAAVYGVAQSRARLKRLSSSRNRALQNCQNVCTTTGFSSGASGKEPTYQCRKHKTKDEGLIPVSGRCSWGACGNPLQYSCLENPMDRGAWWATIHTVTKSQIRLKWLNTHRYITVVVISNSNIKILIQNKWSSNLLNPLISVRKIWKISIYN